MDGCSERFENRTGSPMDQWFIKPSTKLISTDWRGFAFFSLIPVRFRERLDVDWIGRRTTPAMSMNTFQVLGSRFPGQVFGCLIQALGGNRGNDLGIDR